MIFGIENRIEQIIANLLDNSISFSDDNQKILVKIDKDLNNKIILKIIDQGKVLKKKILIKFLIDFIVIDQTSFGEHSGLGLNIVKNLVELHGGIINASNNANH